MKKGIFVLVCCILLLATSCYTSYVIPPRNAATDTAAQPAAQQIDISVIDSWSTLKAAVESTKDKAEYAISADLVADAETGTITIPYGMNVTITDDGTPRTVSRGTLTTELFNVEDGASLTLKGTAAGSLVLDGKDAEALSAGVVSAGSFTAENVVFRSFRNSADSGAVLISLGSGTFTGCTFDSNTANAGAAINTITKTGSTLTITGCSFTNNTATTNGAAINGMNNTTIKLSDSQFTGNKTTATAKNKGGAALYMAVTQSDIRNCTFTDNVVKGVQDGSLTGGAILYYCVGSSDTVNTIDGCTFSGNGGVVYGGAIGIGDNGKERTKDGVIEITNCTFNGNSAQYGTGLTSRYDLNMVAVRPTVKGCTFNSDTAWFVKKATLVWEGNNIEPIYQ